MPQRHLNPTAKDAHKVDLELGKLIVHGNASTTKAPLQDTLNTKPINNAKMNNLDSPLNTKLANGGRWDRPAALAVGSRGNGVASISLFSLMEREKQI